MRPAAAVTPCRLRTSEALQRRASDRPLVGCYAELAGAARNAIVLVVVCAGMTGQEIGDFGAVLGPKRLLVAQRVANVAFGMSAITLSGDRQKVPGSGVFIAPYLGLTAKHVVTDVMRLHTGPAKEGEPLSVALKLHQVATFDQEKFRTMPMPAWNVREFIECPYSDLALLDVFPANTAAEEFAASRWNDSMFRIRMLPPDPNARVRVFGFPGKQWNFDPESKRLDVTSGISMSEGRVTEVFPDWRQEPVEPPPAILGPSINRDQGLLDFPCFEMTAPVEEGMSGGPVFYGDDLLGIVSTGFELEEGDETDAARSRAASLWPLIFTRNIPTGLERVDFLTLLRSALMNCPDWRDAEARAYLEDRYGRRRARIKRTDLGASG
jgi:hypothetical protein